MACDMMEPAEILERLLAQAEAETAAAAPKRQGGYTRRNYTGQRGTYLETETDRLKLEWNRLSIYNPLETGRAISLAERAERRAAAMVASGNDRAADAWARAQMLREHAAELIEIRLTMREIIREKAARLDIDLDNVRTREKIEKKRASLVARGIL